MFVPVEGLSRYAEQIGSPSSVTAPSQALLKIIDWFTPLTPGDERMAAGLDMGLHGESACKDKDPGTCPGCSNPPSLNQRLGGMRKLTRWRDHRPRCNLSRADTHNLQSISSVDLEKVAVGGPMKSIIRIIKL